MSHFSLLALLALPLISSAFLLAPVPGGDTRANARLQAAIDKFNAAVAKAGDNYENSKAVHAAFKNMIAASVVYASSGAIDRSPAGASGGKNVVGTVGSVRI